MAPESVCTESSRFGGRQLDLWAMGVTLFCFLRGRTPFSAANSYELYEQIRTQPLELQRAGDVELPPGAAGVLSALLNKDPAARASLAWLREQSWVAGDGEGPTMIPREQNCAPIEVTPAEIDASLPVGRSQFGSKQRTMSDPGGCPASPEQASTFSLSLSRRFPDHVHAAALRSMAQPHCTTLVDCCYRAPLWRGLLLHALFISR